MTWKLWRLAFKRREWGLLGAQLNEIKARYVPDVLPKGKGKTKGEIRRLMNRAHGGWGPWVYAPPPASPRRRR